VPAAAVIFPDLFLSIPAAASLVFPGVSLFDACAARPQAEQRSGVGAADRLRRLAFLW
jgi:hypothetical protein